MNAPHEQVTDLVLERYLARDLPRARCREIETALASSVALRDRLATLERERDAFLMSDPPERFAHRVAVTVATRAPKRRPLAVRLADWLAPLGAVSAGVVVTVVIMSRPDALQQKQGQTGREDSADGAPPTAMQAPAPPPMAITPAVVPTRPAGPAASTGAAASRARTPTPVAPTIPAGKAIATPSVASKRVLAPREMKEKAAKTADDEGSAGWDKVAAESSSDLAKANVPTSAAPAPTAAAAPSSEEAATSAAATESKPSIVVRGGLEPAAVATVVRSHKAAITALWRGDAPNQEPLRVQFVINEKGRVSTVRVLNAEVSSELLTRVSTAIRAWRFPAAANGAPTSVGAVF